MPEFVHLHLHTEYSLLDGACRIGELLAEAERLKMPALAVTEHGNLFSAIVFHDKARQRGIKPILGCEVYVAPGSRLTRGGPIAESSNHLILLAETNEGFHNLVKLTSSAYTEGFYYKPRIDKDLLARHSKGLIALSSCLKGEVPSALRADQAERAAAAAATYRDILGAGNFFLELQYQGIEEQRIVNDGLLPLSRDLGIPLVCTNDVHYLRRDDFRPHDVLLCIGTGRTVNDAERMRYHGDQFYLKTPEEMASVFGHLPEAMRNTVAIADRCNVDLSDSGPYLPNFQVPDGFTLEGYFEHVVREGFEMRLARLREMQAAGSLRHAIDEYGARLQYEIDVIKRMQYPGYFLITWDFIRYAREQGIPVGPGRGSAAGSLVAYCLRITDVDPLQFDLLFERFLNPERISLPDIDIDFCERRRGEVIEYVTRKYGRENVAQIITFGTMKAKAVVRDVGRVMDMSVRGRGPGGEADSRRARDDAGEGAGREPRAPRDGAERRPGLRSARRREAARGDGAPRLGARRGRGHRAAADHRVRAALQGEPRRNHDAVGDEGDRAHRAAQDGLPRPEHADAHPRRPRADRGDHGRARRDGGPAPHRREDVRPVLRGPDARHLPVRELGHAADPPAGPAAGSSKT